MSQSDASEHSFIVHVSEDDYQTPSPADSSVRHLEQVLRETEGETVYLRYTHEQNEQVIFGVYEEKEKTLDREIRKIKIKVFLNLTFCHAPFMKIVYMLFFLFFQNFNQITLIPGMWKTQLNTHQMKAKHIRYNSLL